MGIAADKKTRRSWRGAGGAVVVAAEEFMVAVASPAVMVE
jgi:hypothetical protein